VHGQPGVKKLSPKGFGAAVNGCSHLAMSNTFIKSVATKSRSFRPSAYLNYRKVFFFDIDNCLYPKSYQIHDKMAVLIDNYFQNHLSLSEEDATILHQRYYKDYGLAIEGLVRHHKVDPLEYNDKVDDALPLDDIIKPDPKLRKLLQDIDSEKVRLHLFTNAYVNHAKRVTRLLGVDDLFGGMTYCDYSAEKLLCKPSIEMYDKAMREAKATNPSDCYFVG
jgi:pyrimidine and pyridine-specific 5'-nucleotidase